MGIEPTEDASQRPPPVLKTGPVTRSGRATGAECSRKRPARWEISAGAFVEAGDLGAARGGTFEERGPRCRQRGAGDGRLEHTHPLLERGEARLAAAGEQGLLLDVQLAHAQFVALQDPDRERSEQVTIPRCPSRTWSCARSAALSAAA